MNRLFLDQGLPRSAASILRARGWDVQHAGETGHGTADDLEILEYAGREERTVVTLDADFHSLLMVGRLKSPSVIRIRIEGLRGEDLADVLGPVLTDLADDLVKGAMVTVTQKTVRVHRLR